MADGLQHHTKAISTSHSRHGPCGEAMPTRCVKASEVLRWRVDRAQIRRASSIHTH